MACAGKALVWRDAVGLHERTRSNVTAGAQTTAVVRIDANLGDGASFPRETVRWCVVPRAKLGGLVDAALRGPWAEELAIWLAKS